MKEKLALRLIFNIHFFSSIRTNLIRTPRIRFAIGQRAKSKTNDHYRK